jgi:plastin-1
MHWLNWHLKRAGYAKQVSNFGSDLADGLAYAHLMHSLSSTAMSRQSLEQVCRLDCGMERANRVLDATRLIDPVSAQFLQAEDLCAGREKLNLCFLASLFNSGTGMRPINDELKAVNDQLSGSLDAERNRARTLERNVSSMESRVRYSRDI